MRVDTSKLVPNQIKPNNNPRKQQPHQPAEVARGTAEGAVNFPLSTLRGSLDKVPKDKRLYVFCQVGDGPGAGPQVFCRSLQGGGASVGGHLSAGLQRSNQIQPNLIKKNQTKTQIMPGRPPRLQRHAPADEHGARRRQHQRRVAERAAGGGRAWGQAGRQAVIWRGA